MQFCHFIAGSVVWHWPSCPEAQLPVLTNRDLGGFVPAHATDRASQEDERWWVVAQAEKAPGVWLFQVSSAEASSTEISSGPLRIELCPSSRPVARHKTPRLLPRGIYCHWRGCATSILTSILLACPPHSSTAASLDPPCPAASRRSCKAPFPPDSQGQGCFPRLVCSPAVPLPEPIAPTKLPGSCQLLTGRRRDCWE